MKQTNLAKGILFILCSAFFTCIGQLLWKISSMHASALFFLFGSILYGLGAILMIISFRYGDLSVLHPIMSVGYILAIVLGAIFFHETITFKKVCGILLIIFGIICLSLPHREDKS